MLPITATNRDNKCTVAMERQHQLCHVPTMEYYTTVSISDDFRQCTSDVSVLRERSQRQEPLVWEVPLFQGD